jgi:hypothetical protein
MPICIELKVIPAVKKAKRALLKIVNFETILLKIHGL